MSEADYAQAQADFDAAVALNETLLPNYAGFGGINGSAINATELNGSNLDPAALPEIDSTTFTLYCDGEVVYSRQLVADQSAFKLPAGFRTDNVAVGVTGSLRIKAIKLADTMQGLKAV
jgi:hypothetical protein